MLSYYSFILLSAFLHLSLAFRTTNTRLRHLNSHATADDFHEIISSNLKSKVVTAGFWLIIPSLFGISDIFWAQKVAASSFSSSGKLFD